MNEQELINEIINQKYKYGFTSSFDYLTKLKPGLSAKTVSLISQLNNESSYLRSFRSTAYSAFLTKLPPQWSNIDYDDLNLANISFFAEPKVAAATKISDLDPKLREMLRKLDIPVAEQQRLYGVATDVVVDSKSVLTTFNKKLAAAGVIFCPINEACKKYPELIQQYLGSVVAVDDNYFAALNSAVFSGGSFVYIPKNTKCPVDLSTYFRLNSLNVGQFERTLIIAEPNSQVNYLEGCTAPAFTQSQLHAAVVEIVAKENSIVNYSTIQNWYAGDNGVGGVYNFVTKRAHAARNALVSWCQIETGAAKTWKYPSINLVGHNARGIFNSLTISKDLQQADTGTKMKHIGNNTKSTINSKSISAGKARSTYRALILVDQNCSNASAHSSCDSLLLSDQCQAITLPHNRCSSTSALIDHEATTFTISAEQMFYCQQRGIAERELRVLISVGFSKNIISLMPLEFAAEAKQLIELVLLDATA